MKVILLSHTLDGATLCGQAAAVCTASRNPAKSLRAALASGHESILEHVSFTFRIEGLSRAALAQLTRHRLASFDVQSQRCNEDGKGAEYSADGASELSRRTG